MDDALEKTPEQSEMFDPDLEVLLSLLQGVVVPAITVLGVIADSVAISEGIGQARRDAQEDTRRSFEILLQMENDLYEAEHLLNETNKFIIQHNLAHIQVWPPGINGMRLTQDGYADYLQNVSHICALLRRMDMKGIELSTLIRRPHILSTLQAQLAGQWMVDLNQARKLQEKINKAHTFGEKSRYLGFSIKMCRGVIIQSNAVLHDLHMQQTAAIQNPVARPESGVPLIHLLKMKMLRAIYLIMGDDHDPSQPRH